MMNDKPASSRPPSFCTKGGLGLGEDGSRSGGTFPEPPSILVKIHASSSELIEGTLGVRESERGNEIVPRISVSCDRGNT